MTTVEISEKTRSLLDIRSIELSKMMKKRLTLNQSLFVILSYAGQIRYKPQDVEKTLKRGSK